MGHNHHAQARAGAYIQRPVLTIARCREAFFRRKSWRDPVTWWLGGSVSAIADCLNDAAHERAPRRDRAWAAEVSGQQFLNHEDPSDHS
jgi:hypothetical protein